MSKRYRKRRRIASTGTCLWRYHFLADIRTCVYEKRITLKHPTEPAEFNIVLRDGTAANGTIFPGSARGILLYAVSPRSYKVNEDLRVEQTGKKLVIRWTHNANSNMLWTNDKGEIELANCASTLQTCDNIAGEIVVKDEFLKAGGNKSNRADIDWNKVLPLMNPTVLTSTTAKWDGKLTAAYKNGILTIKGNLTLKKL